MKKRWLALLLALALSLGLSAPALAAGSEEIPPAEAVTAQEETAAQEPSDWAYPTLADAYSLKLLDDNYGSYLQDPVTEEQLAALTAVVADKLALLGAQVREETGEPLVLDTTRGGVVNALYQELARYALPGAELSPAEALESLGVLQGDGSSLALERRCTYQEAMALATRLILAVYDGQDAGSKGLLWKVEQGENTLYLLGTYHVDRGNLYPFHKTLREALLSADQVILELDLSDQAGMMEFVAMQTYPQGDSLDQHISPELFDRTAALFAALGMTQEQVAAYKPWALANSLNTLLTADDSTGDTMLAVDSYVNAAALYAHIPVSGAETYALQGGVFDSLSEDYQAAYLESCVTLLETAWSGEEETADPEAQAALEAQQEALTAVMDAWKAGDLEGFCQLYDKEAIVNSDDELSAKLFTDRDPGMIQVARNALEQEEPRTTFMAVGAGHMTAPGGIVPALEDLGYTVTQMK